MANIEPLGSVYFVAADFNPPYINARIFFEFRRNDAYKYRIKMCRSYGTYEGMFERLRRIKIRRYKIARASGSIRKGQFSKGTNRVNRGGSWNNNATNCRAANRNNNTPTNRNNNVGFRVVFTL